MKQRSLYWALALCVLLPGCSWLKDSPSTASQVPPSGPGKDGAPSRTLDPAMIQDAVPRWEAITARGNVSPYVVMGRRYELMTDYRDYRERGTASWYGTKFHGRLTSNGEVYDLYKMTAAHKTLPIPVYVEVTNLSNGRTAVVRVNDRGPFHGDRIIDLSYAAAVKLGFADKGTAPVEIRVIDLDNKRHSAGVAREQAPESHYFLQIAAFQVKGSALRLQAELAGRHELPVHIHASDDSPPFYRVRVGPFTDYLEAERVRRKLEQDNYGLASIVTHSR
ncbi:rare lipoprotein A [Litorivivens lipolytica]|uniref:Endolytic peptidoglycan transglycosylase RlpA n=1 Tax=Litorivivens lipolytica TaxID=1524264 RepID=A0A7W4W4C5_9GAMM|nr:septal ring lytic transglycosylase RlpA family protein [Litorivivens lipolytica]MBB3047184.1 rare lipoprotein A [Litorivivens lipolytica]